MSRFVWLTALFMALGMSAPTFARQVTPAEHRNPAWTAHVPACDSPAVLEKVQTGFAEREANYWRLGLTISSVDRIRPIAWRPWGADYIPRRYCVARARTSDGRVRTLSYNIIEGAGPIGMTWGVEWCVSGLDRLFYYAPDCKMARP